jgi:aspartokinase
MISAGEEGEQPVSVGGLACDRKLLHVHASHAQAAKARVPMNALIAALRGRGAFVSDVFDSATACSFTLRTSDLGEMRSVLKTGEYPMVCTEEIAKVSMVGTGLATDLRVDAKASDLMKSFGIKVRDKLVSDTSISVFVDLPQAEETMRVLHDGLAIGVGG